MYLFKAFFIASFAGLLGQAVPAKAQQLTEYEACPSQRILQCCNSIIAGVGGDGTAVGNGCKDPPYSVPFSEVFYLSVSANGVILRIERRLIHPFLGIQPTQTKPNVFACPAGKIGLCCVGSVGLHYPLFPVSSRFGSDRSDR